MGTFCTRGATQCRGAHHDTLADSAGTRTGPGGPPPCALARRSDLRPSQGPGRHMDGAQHQGLERGPALPGHRGRVGGTRDVVRRASGRDDGDTLLYGWAAPDAHALLRREEPAALDGHELRGRQPDRDVHVRRRANLPTRDHGHMDKVVYHFTDGDHTTSQWTWFQDQREQWMEKIEATRKRGSTR